MRIVLAALAMIAVPAMASGRCESPDEADALHTAALQQEMMVAASSGAASGRSGLDGLFPAHRGASV